VSADGCSADLQRADQPNLRARPPVSQSFVDLEHGRVAGGAVQSQDAALAESGKLRTGRLRPLQLSAKPRINTQVDEGPLAPEPPECSHLADNDGAVSLGGQEATDALHFKWHSRSREVGFQSPGQVQVGDDRLGCLAGCVERQDGNRAL
jgi:hypothetical protein